MNDKKLGTGRLLLVDDDPLVRRAIGRFLSKVYDFVDVASAGEAEAELDGQCFDLILLDIELSPGVTDGLDCLRWLPDTGHRGAVCMLTGHLSPELLHEALLLGADDYLVKLGDYKLKDEIERLVELGRLPREERPRYETIADPGLLRSLRLNAD
jgi:DNA-binding response OmpR family regulator